MLAIRFWREILILVLCICIGLGFYLFSNKIDMKNLEIEALNVKNASLIEDLGALQKRSEEQQKKLMTHEQLRRSIDKNYEKQLALLKKQKIPTSCPDAIRFAVEQRGDLEWKPRQSQPLQ